MLVSVVIPCYRSANMISGVVDEVRREILFKQGYDYQIILVNDASPDDTYGIIEKLCAEDPKIVGINLAKNYGQAAARLAAIPYIKGNAAVFMDDDGQHPPYELYKLIEKIDEGYDLVYAEFGQKKHSPFRRFTSWLHYILLELVGLKLKGVALSSFFAVNAYMIKCLHDYKSPFPAINSYMIQFTRKIVNVSVEHKERKNGKSGYTLKKLIALWLNDITSFSIVPLRICIALGFLCSLFSFIFGIVLAVRRILNPAIPAGYTTTIASIYFVGGILMILLGLLGEYIGRTFFILSNVPQYSVRDTLNAENADAKKDAEHMTL